MKKDTATALAMMEAFGGKDVVRSALPKREKKAPKKCLLPECEEMTSHNGGYCCAEHCKEHRRRMKHEHK